MDQLAKLGPLAALTKLWNDLSPAQRVVVLSFVALSAIAVVFIGMALSKPHMSVVFSGLESEDAGAIVQKLSEQKVPYELSADGTTVSVPSNQADEIRLQMATQGLPAGGNVGFGLFDKQNFGMTEFAEKVTYMRAIQGELTRTITQLAPVMDARVHLVMPEDKLYSSEQQPATGAVKLKLRRGMTLSDDQVGGIVHLVASAVEGLKPENITVIDSTGHVLYESNGSGIGGMLTSNQNKMKRQYESELSQNIQSMLTPIVGAEKAVVRVSADMTFDQEETKSETYEPATTAGAGAAAGATPAGAQTGNTEAPQPRGILLSEETKSESYSGAVMPPGGVPPVRATSNQNRATSGGDNYIRTETTAQYNVTKTIKQVVSAPGQLKRLSVAVLVDDKAVADPAKVSAIREAVVAAAGIDNKRGDQITVQRMAFDTTAEKTEAADMAKASKAAMMQTILKNGGAVLLLLAFLFALKMIVKQIKLQTPEASDGVASALSAQQMATVQDLLKGTSQPQPTADARADGGDQFSTAPAQSAMPSEVTQSSPEELAKLVRTWMAES